MHDKAVSWQQELDREHPSRPSSSSPREGERQTWPYPIITQLPYAPNSTNTTKQWPRKQSAPWLCFPLPCPGIHLGGAAGLTSPPCPSSAFGISQSHLSGCSKTALPLLA